MRRCLCASRMRSNWVSHGFPVVMAKFGLYHMQLNFIVHHSWFIHDLPMACKVVICAAYWVYVSSLGDCHQKSYCSSWWKCPLCESHIDWPLCENQRRPAHPGQCPVLQDHGFHIFLRGHRLLGVNSPCLNKSQMT